MRRPILLLSFCLWGCGPGAEAENESGVTIALPPALPPAPLEPEAKPEPEPAPEPAAPIEKKGADEDSGKTATAPEEERPRQPSPLKPKAPEKKAEERDRPSTKSPDVVESTGERPPLSDALIASTIRRIGYPCSSVRSTSAMPGEGSTPGGYRISCSSGETYRGSVTNGRMRFRKLGGADR